MLIILPCNTLPQPALLLANITNCLSGPGKSPRPTWVPHTALVKLAARPQQQAASAVPVGVALYKQHEDQLGKQNSNGQWRMMKWGGEMQQQTIWIRIYWKGKPSNSKRIWMSVQSKFPIFWVVMSHSCLEHLSDDPHCTTSRNPLWGIFLPQLFLKLPGDMSTGSVLTVTCYLYLWHLLPLSAILFSATCPFYGSLFAGSQLVVWSLFFFPEHKHPQEWLRPEYNV